MAGTVPQTWEANRLNRASIQAHGAPRTGVRVLGQGSAVDGTRLQAKTA